MTPAAPATAVFQPGLDLRPALETVRTHGAAFIEHALANAFLEQLRREADAVPYEPLAASEGHARQEGEMHVIHGVTGNYPAIEHLRAELVIRSCSGGSMPGPWSTTRISIRPPLARARTDTGPAP